MKVSDEMINDMIQTLERELGEEHYYLCRAETECFSQEALSAIWNAIEKSHLNILRTYLKVVIGQDGIDTLLKVFESEAEIHEIICDETDFELNEPHLDELYEYIPKLLTWVEETRRAHEEKLSSTEEAA
jgi:hypothetical protein